MLEMPKTQSVLWTESVTKAENSLSKRLERESLEEEEDLSLMMCATSAKKRVTGLTNAETREREEEDILAPDLVPPLIPEEVAEEETEVEEEEDPTLLLADLNLILETESTEEEEEGQEQDLTLPEEALVPQTAERTDLVLRPQEVVLTNLEVPEPDPKLQEEVVPSLREAPEVDPEDLTEVVPRPQEDPTEATTQEVARTPDPRAVRELKEAEADQLRRETDQPPSHQRSLIK